MEQIRIGEVAHQAHKLDEQMLMNVLVHSNKHLLVQEPNTQVKIDLTLCTGTTDLYTDGNQRYVVTLVQGDSYPMASIDERKHFEREYAYEKKNGKLLTWVEIMAQFLKLDARYRYHKATYDEKHGLHVCVTNDRENARFWQSNLASAVVDREALRYMLHMWIQDTTQHGSNNDCLVDAFTDELG